MNIQSLDLVISASQTIKAYQYTPDSDVSIRGHVVIASAMGVAQLFYRPFATWLSKQGFTVLTFDCRGMGESRIRPLNQYHVDVLDWVKDDYSVALHYVLNRSSNLPVYWIGHSLGGQVFPLVKNIEQVTKVITISSGTGYWKHNAPPLRKKAPLFWYLIMPIATVLMGYFPGKRLGMVGDLPKKVMFQWRRWCLHKDYCVGVESQTVKDKFAKIDVPLHSICFTDDEMLSVTNMRDLHALFGHPNKRLHEVVPKDMQEKHIGHLGFFREKFLETLWPTLVLTELNPK